MNAYSMPEPGGFGGEDDFLRFGVIGLGERVLTAILGQFLLDRT